MNAQESLPWWVLVRRPSDAGAGSRVHRAAAFDAEANHAGPDIDRLPAEWQAADEAVERIDLDSSERSSPPAGGSRPAIDAQGGGGCPRPRTVRFWSGD